MKTLVQCELYTSPFNTSGWTAIRESGRPVSYIREISPNKVSPPQDCRTVVLQENGAQVTLAIPFLPDKIEYLESHIVELGIGKDVQKESQVIGCKCILHGVDLRTNQLAPDQREMLLVFMQGSKTIQVELNQEGGLLVSTK